MQRIPVTHAGSLIRPPALLSFLAAKDHGQPYDEAAYAAALRTAVTDVVRGQVEAGVDVVDDGEMGKPDWITYLYERVSGLESRPMARDLSTILPPSRDRQAFPGAYAALDALDAAATRGSRGVSADKPDKTDQSTGPKAGPALSYFCTGPLGYDPRSSAGCTRRSSGPSWPRWPRVPG